MPLAEKQPSTPSGAARFLLGGVPLWIGIVTFLSVAAIVLVGLVLRVEWARIAVVAAIDAAVGAGLILIAMIVILLVRRARWLTLGLSALLMLTMGLGSVAALTNQPVFHRLQGQNLENSKQWAAAITQYSRAGEAPPHAPDIARVRLKWGEEFLAGEVYDLAVDEFHQALADDERSATGDRANRDLYKAFTAWLQAGPPDDILRTLSSFLDGYIQTPLCDSACQQVTRPLAAQALYLYGALQLKQNRTYCDTAIAAYKDVASRYADTTSGQKAALDLTAPVTYVASIFDFPVHGTTPAYLSRTARPTGNGYFSDDYTALIDSEGDATFQNVPPGSYNFSVVFKGERWYWDAANHSNVLTATVTPLCKSTQFYSW
jgi:hypothetical protein